MGLSATLSNALSGLRIGQNALDVLSHNVANSGTPGYNKRSISVVDTLGANSVYAREGIIARAFNKSLQQHYTRAVSESGFSSVRADFLDRVQTILGKPGTTGSVDLAFGKFQTALTKLAASPDNFASRADAVQQAQLMAETLNRMSADVQSLRQEIEGKIATAVDDINSMLSSLEKINARVADRGIDPSARATLLDQRDRLVTDISMQLDVRVSYRDDGSVALMTRSGVGILDGRASLLEFESAGALSATSVFSPDPAQNGVGSLSVRSASGLSIDLVKQNVLRAGELAGLVRLRDDDLVEVQAQLDEIASGLALAMSTEVTAGTAASSGAATGFAVDIGAVRNGNAVTFGYLSGGIERTVHVVRVDDASKLPLDYEDANGARVIGLDFSGGAASIALQLQDRFGASLQFSGAGSTLTVLDDGIGSSTDVLSLESRHTVSGTQTGERALSLFVDNNNLDYTGALDGVGQKMGFASRIRVNQAVLNDSKLIVQFQPGGSLGDASRVDRLTANLDGMRFAGGADRSGFRLAGTVSDLINQTINYQGNAASTALDDRDTQALTLDALSERLDAEYGVDVDEEMARLMELQNAYAANARVVAAAQQLIDALLQI
jgi:flagellar hook-associated protein 1